MLRLLRAQRWLLALAATILVTGLAGEALALDHGHHEVGAICQPAGVQHDADAHRIGAAERSSEHAHEHCYVCHWVRSFRPAEQSRRIGADRLVAGQLHYPLNSASGRLVVSQLPARSPPV
ncbi:MAG TPA: hypothetical protein DCP38_08055 [Acidobacteria bacterium]|jgi:hypothetical protein|nr:hypothetical protein [Acidobacteriota bacterium]HAK55419.1 hypothetical protein [Acidobacteriota bacterium]|tara:strand:- start:12116 stop:12478 length:363 start_codon:yes stop_codon:yes gene_type:complete